HRRSDPCAGTEAPKLVAQCRERRPVCRGKGVDDSLAPRRKLAMVNSRDLPELSLDAIAPDGGVAMTGNHDADAGLSAGSAHHAKLDRLPAEPLALSPDAGEVTPASQPQRARQPARLRRRRTSTEASPSGDGDPSSDADSALPVPTWWT